MAREVDDTLLPVSTCAPQDKVELRAFKGYSHEASVIVAVNAIEGETYCGTLRRSTQAFMSVRY